MASALPSSHAASALPPNVKILSKEELVRDEQKRQEEMQDMFKHGASPFRTHPDAPPKFSWTHAWGMMTWGKKAGAWGKGVEGLDERAKEDINEYVQKDGREGKDKKKGD